ncbi:MAG: glycosyltransferase family 2 protein, partial [Bacteroidales bacterium]|nr:glycosyltransferase family 2 protein [Bacteroidales bacterium]
MTKIAIVILNYNGEHFLRQLLPSVVSNSPEAEVIVADNASTDGSIAFLKQEMPDIRIIEMDKNYGFAEGYNQALRHVEAEYYVLLNSDVEVTPHWLVPLVDYMERHPQVAACQPKIRSFHHREQFEYAGAAGGFIDALGYPFCRGRIFGTLENDESQYDTIEEVFWATGACLMIRSHLYHQLGGLDSGFFAHMEEIDLCWRVKARGYKIVCIPQSFVFHVGGGTLSAESPHKTYLNFRNNLLMIYKNRVHHCHGVIACRYLLDGVAALQMLLQGKPKNVKAVWQAHRDFRKMKPSYTAKRKEN